MTTFPRLPRIALSSRLLLFALLALMLTVVPSVPVARAITSGPYLYIPNTTALVKANLDGTSPFGAMSLAAPTGIAIDVKHGHMYIAESAGNVARYNLDGTNPTPITFMGVTVSLPMGIALDLVHDKIYVASSGSNRVIKADLTGANAVSLSLNSMLSAPWDIALDTIHDKMYVTNYVGNKVISATLNGANAAEMNFGTVALSNPTGIALDFYYDRIYIANYGNDSVVSSGLDGGNATVLTNLGTSVRHPSGIAVDSSDHKIYIASTGGGGTPAKIIRALLDGGNPTDLSAQSGWSGLLSMPYFLAFDTPPDLEAKFYLETASVPAGNAFNWYMQVSNLGPNPAVFGPGQTILKDDLPIGPVYNAPFIANTYGIESTGPVSCSIASNTLTCWEGGGTAVFTPAASKLVFNFTVTTPSTLSTLTNPRAGGVCQADPYTVLQEINIANNSCSTSVVVTAAPAAVRGQKLYVLNNTQAVSRANLDGSGAVNLGNPGGLLASSEDMAVDVEHEWLYMTNYAGAIIRAHLNGSGAQDLGNLSGHLTQGAGIALDVAADRMYVASWNQNKILRAHLDGTFIDEIADLTGQVTGSDAIAADLVHSRLYVAGWTSNNVYRIGPGEEIELTGLNGLLTHPESMAVDPYGGYLFVVDSSSVVRSDLNGNGAAKLTALSTPCPKPRGIAADGNGHIYVGCASTSQIIRAGLDGAGVVDLGSLNGTIAGPNSIALDLTGFLALPLIERH